MTSKVYVVQRPAYFDRSREGWVNKFDLSPAQEYGTLIFMLRPGNVFRDRLSDAVRQLEEVMAEFTKQDHILAVGDPVAISAAVMVASQKTGGEVSVLKFDRQERRYHPYVITLGS